MVNVMPASGVGPELGPEGAAALEPNTVPFSARVLARQTEVQAVATGQNSFVVAWTDNPNETGAAGQTCSAASTRDGGKTWSDPVRFRKAGYDISANPTLAKGPHGQLYLVCFSVNEDFGKGALDLSTSSDGGETWSAWREIKQTGKEGIPDRPKLVVGKDGTLHLVFTAFFSDPHFDYRTAIHYTRSANQGADWDAEQELSGQRSGRIRNINGYQGASLLELGSGDLVVAWGDYYGPDTHVRRSPDAGRTFEAAVDIPGPATREVPCAELAADATGKHVVMTVHEGHDLGSGYRFWSQDGARSWTQSEAPSAKVTNFAMVFDDRDRLHQIWLSGGKGTLDTLYATSSDFGETFEATISLAGGAYPYQPSDRGEAINALGSYQSIVTENGLPVAFWLDFRSSATKPRISVTSWSRAAPNQ